jgi:hypothetical protein
VFQRRNSFLVLVPENAGGTGVDYLTHTIYKLAAGSLDPDAALRQLRALIEEKSISIPMCVAQPITPKQ